MASNETQPKKSSRRRGTASMESDTRYYEGCGRQGPIQCIFISIFHPVEGPKITCQFPEDYLSKEIFDAVSAYIIPKPQLQKCTMTINSFGHKIVGYPIRMESTRYERNAFLFNLCFVCDSWSKTVQYEGAVKKLGEYLTIMEEESRFVSDGSSRLPTLLAHLLHDLNTHRKATLLEGDTAMHLKVVDIRNDPVTVKDSDVPILTESVGLPRPGRPPKTPPPPNGQESSFQHFRYDEHVYHVDLEDEWDLTTKQILPFIDGFNHIQKIAAEADVDVALVKSCVQNLLYYGVVLLMPILKFSNMYRACPSLNRIFKENDLQMACLNFITPPLPSHLSEGVPNEATGSEAVQKKPKLSEAIEILCALQQGTTLRLVCERYASAKDGSLDVRRLVIFALLHGFIRCLQRYPVYTGKNVHLTGARQELYRMLNGSKSVDEICCLSGWGQMSLEHIIEDDPEILFMWK